MGSREIQQTSEALDVFVGLSELVVIGCVGDRGHVKNGVEVLIAELLAPIQPRHIGRDKIAAVSTEILEITGAKIIDYGQARVRKFFLQVECKIGADEPSSAGDKQIGRGTN